MKSAVQDELFGAELRSAQRFLTLRGCLRGLNTVLGRLFDVTLQPQVGLSCLPSLQLLLRPSAVSALMLNHAAGADMGHAGLSALHILRGSKGRCRRKPTSRHRGMLSSPKQPDFAR